MAAKGKTVAEAFGPEVADELAKWAIDALCHGDLPERQGQHVYAVKLPWRVLNEGRAILERGGIDWRGLLSAQKREQDERARRV